MRTMLHRVALAITLAAATLGCAEDTMAPAGATSDETAFSYEGPLTTGDYWVDEAAALAVMPPGGFVMHHDSLWLDRMRPDSMRHRGGRGQGGDRQGGRALVIHLLRRALYEYAETNGDSAALALAEPVRDLLDQARETFLAGDSAAAAALVRQAYTAAATIVIDLRGAGPLDTLTAMVDRGLARLDSVIARGVDADRDVSALIALRDFVIAQHAEAATLRAAGDLPGALVAESIAAQSLGRAMHRVRGDGRGEREGRGYGMGRGHGMGRGRN